MISRVDPEASIREWLALGKARDADSLHRVLTMHPPARRSADTVEPMWLLKRVADSEPEETFSTAFLLLTDLRWRKGVSQLVRRVEESGCLGREELDELARLFIAAAKALFWAVPEEWFSGHEVVIVELDGEDTQGANTDLVGDEEADDTPRVAREVPPPLRRWAAARIVEGDPSQVDALVGRAQEVDARAAAAIMAGILDCIDEVDPEVGDRLIDDAVEWSDQGVRRAGLELVARRDGTETAYRLAAKDPNARIRAWAESLLDDPAGDEPAARDAGSPADAKTGDQQSLF